MEDFRVFSCNKVMTLIHSRGFVHHIFIFEKCSFVMRVDILDKNDILLEHSIPTGANPDTVNPLPTPNPTPPNKISETITNTVFLFKLLNIFL